MQRTETAWWRRLAPFGLALALVGMACGDDSEKSDADAELQEFITLGTLRLSADDGQPVELGTAAAVARAQILGASVNSSAEVGVGDEVHAALTEEPPVGITGFGFVLTGCAETGARLVVTSNVVSAELIGNEDVDCEAPVYFLATFHMPIENVPEGAVLS